MFFKSALIDSDAAVQAVRTLLHRLGSSSTIVDFEEHLLIPSVRSTMRLWRRRARLVGVAFVDDYANLWLESDPAAGLSAVELETLCSEQIAWGEACLRKHSPDDRAGLSLDSCCPASDSQRIAALLKHGFLLQELRTLRYSRPLSQPSQGLPLPNSQGCLPH